MEKPFFPNDDFLYRVSWVDISIIFVYQTGAVICVNWSAGGETGTFPLIRTLYKPGIFNNQRCLTNRYCLLTSTEPRNAFRFRPGGFPCFDHLYVRPSVCPEATGHSFLAFDLGFDTHHSCRLRKKSNSCFF